MTRNKHIPGWYAVVLAALGVFIAPIAASASPMPATPQAASMQALDVSAAAAPQTLTLGSTGPRVTEVQKALANNKWAKYFKHPEFTQYFGSVTQGALAAWERDNVRSYPDTARADGKITVGSAEWSLLMAQAVNKPASDSVPAACLQAVHIICADKSDEHLRYYRSGVLVKDIKVKFGKPSTPTPNGWYTVVNKFDGDDEHNPYHMEWSYAFNVPMYWSMQFDSSVGLSIHWSEKYAQLGEAHLGSAGCINVRYWNDAKWLNENVPYRATVYVYQR